MPGSASQAGFYYQNNIAALKIIECLFFDSDITHIELENYEKGNHIDDVIVYGNNRIHYIQVKWSNDGEKVYSLYNLLTPNDGKKSLFKQLAEGYNSVKSNGKDFSITLFTTRKESGHKRKSQGVDFGLKDVRNNIFKAVKSSTVRYDRLGNFADYENTIEKVRAECGLDKDDFNDFIKKLDFKFSQESIEQIQNIIRFRLEKLGFEESIFDRLLDNVVKWSISGEKITKDTLLKQLGIADRFDDKISHYFKIVDDKYYVPNEDLQAKLIKALSELDGGYIFIEGLPGIGKSTALTKFKETYPEVTLAYYCFIPDTKNNFGELRHQAHHFLKSLCISIENQFAKVDLPNRYSDRYDEKFLSYIDKLSTIEKTVIFIIDGLDHVHRDTSIQENSLLSQIKGQLPQNVFFILSSQYKTVLSNAVALEIDSDPRRHITVGRFSQLQIQKYLKNKGIEADDILNQIERVSNGIPLYLNYISELLIKTEGTDYPQVLKDLPDLDNGEIDSYHQYLYQKIENDEFKKWVLAVLAYRKENSKVETIVKILKLAGENKSITDVTKVLNTFSHLLKVSNGSAYTISHNSFREFILSKTEDLKDKFNAALVAYYDQTPFTDESYRNYFKHLYEIGEYEKIISSTTLDWLKSAWKNYRTVAEIKDNLDTALNACVESLSLSQFIRVAFIKSQFLKLSWNLEMSEIDFPALLLKTDEVANSLRSIWDGDFVLVNQGFFCDYLGKYHFKTGTLPPKDVLHQGFSKPSLDRGPESTALLFKTKALVFGNTKELIDEIDSIQWINSNNHRADYHKEKTNDEENAQINLKIKLDVVDYLEQHNEYEKLNQLSISLKEIDNSVRIKCQIALIKLLLPSDKKSAIDLIKEIDFQIISDVDYIDLIVFGSDHLTNLEIINLLPKRNLSLPPLHEKVIPKNQQHYQIHEEIISLTDKLKPIWIYTPEIINQLLLGVSALSSPSKNLYNSVFCLSELWHKNRTISLSEDTKLNLAKRAIKKLCVPSLTEYRKVNYGFFDMDLDDTFIQSSIKGLYYNIFNLAIKIFTPNQLTELVSYWLDIEESKNKYRHHTIGLIIAKELNNVQSVQLSHSIKQLIERSEEIARYESETVTLLDYLSEVAETYGLCGFKVDFNRVYNQLFEVAFGLSYKKDYQSSEIISPLEIIHKISPEQSLKRLGDIFHVQESLSEAGNARMNHICLSRLISFVLKHYPELAFKLIEKDEQNLMREEALDIILGPSIKIASKDDLSLYLAVIKTIPRWEQRGIRANHFLSLSRSLIKRSIELKETTFIEAVLNEVKHNTLIELETLEELENFSELLQESRIDYTNYSLPPPATKEEPVEKRKGFSPNEKFKIKYTALQPEILIELFRTDYSIFESKIDSIFEIYVKNRRAQAIRDEYYRSKSTFEKFFKSLPDDLQPNLINVETQVIRHYLTFKQEVVDAEINPNLTIEVLNQYFDEFIQSITPIFPSGSLINFVETEFDKRKWLDGILRFVNEQKGIVFAEMISEDNLFKLVEETPLLKVDNLVLFIKEWTTHRTKSICLLKIADRLVSLNPRKAKTILAEVMEDDAHNRLFPDKYDSRKLDFDILASIFKVDTEFGKKFALKSYLSQKGGGDDSLIDSFDNLIRFQEYFNDEDVSIIFYESNLQYNKELAQGLPKKEDSYKFIENHNETLPLPAVIIKYLIGLFEYPVVKIRELALQSVFDLVDQNPEYLELLMRYGVKYGSDNQVEHSLIILHSISIKQPELLFPLKKELSSLINREHFNILESVKDLLLYLNEVNPKLLSFGEIDVIKNFNTPSPIASSPKKLNNQGGLRDIFSQFQSNLLRILYKNEEVDTVINDNDYTDLLPKRWRDYTFENEGAVHQRYNINSNFDTIEIHSPYYDDVKSSLNKVYHSKIKHGFFNSSFVRKTANQFRLYDPSKLLFKTQLKPEYINWLPEISENAFIRYDNFNTLMEGFVSRDPDYVTLAEFGSQRPKEKSSANQFSTYFKVYAYLKKNRVQNPVEELEDIESIPYLKSENRFAFELPSEHSKTNSTTQEIIPLIEISENNYRGESDITYANLIPEIFREFGIEKKNLLDILINTNVDYPIKALRWQNAYTADGRRRYKPTSEGFTLKVKKETLQKYLLENEMVLCYHISLRRSATTIQPEENMRWYSKTFEYESKL